MSLISDMVIVTSTHEDEAMARLNAWCAANETRYDDDPQQFQRLTMPAFLKLDTDDAGGAKVFSGQVWAMSGNYVHWQRLAVALPTLGWRLPQSVVLIVDAEDSDAPGLEVFRASDTPEGSGR
jgi:hypothetical protein